MQIGDNFVQLRYPPIAEAIVNISVEMGADFNLERATTAFEALVRDRFPDRRPIEVSEASLTRDGGTAPFIVATSTRMLGAIYWNASNDIAVQCRSDGFSYNVVGNYQSWDVVRSAVQPLWNHYQQVCSPKRIKHLGLRYINKIDLIDRKVSELLAVGESELADEAVEFFSRHVLRFDAESRALVVVAISPASADSPKFAMLDIDAVRESTLEPTADLWPLYESVRKIKNTCFFKFVKSPLLEQFA